MEAVIDHARFSGAFDPCPLLAISSSMIWANKASWVVALFLYAHLAPDFFLDAFFASESVI